MRKRTRFRTVVGESVLQQECLGPTFTPHRILPAIPKSEVQLILIFLSRRFRLKRNRINVKHTVKLLFFCIPRHVVHDSLARLSRLSQSFPECRLRNPRRRRSVRCRKASVDIWECDGRAQLAEGLHHLRGDVRDQSGNHVDVFGHDILPFRAFRP